MADSLHRRWALVTALRGVLMLLAGLYAVIAPGSALLLIVTVGAILLIVDGALGLWSLTFGGGKTGNFWFDVVRNALSVITGVLILLSPILSTLLVVWFFVYLFAIQAIIVGGMEVWMAVRERAMMNKVWPVLLSGVLYVLFGIALLFSPLSGAVFFVIFGGVMAILFAFALFGWAWRLYNGQTA